MIFRTSAALLAVHLTLAAGSYAQSNNVTVAGSAPIVAKNTDAARAKALTDAYRSAVEKGLGVWIKSQTEVSNFMLVKDQILSRCEGYVTNHSVLKEGPDGTGMYKIVIEATVNVSKIGADFKAIVGRVKTEMGNPSITFVLTTYEKKGEVSHASESGSRDVNQSTSSQHQQQNQRSGSGNYSATQQASGNASYSASGSSSADLNASRNVTDNNASFSGSYSGSTDQNVQYSGGASAQGSYSGSQAGASSGSASSNVSQSTTYSMQSTSSSFDENLWKKLADATIIDAFQQEFKEKGFDLMATDNARRIALAPSNVQLNINPFDREGVRVLAEKEGANFVARGEAMIIDVAPTSGMQKATVKLGAEIVDVNSGDVVAAYSNTGSALNSSDMEAKAQAIKKVAILGARTLADQTISTWRDRAANGRQFTIVLQGFTSVRSQQRPFVTAVQNHVTKITSTTSPKTGVLMLKVMYQGDKMSLGDAILDELDPKPGFEEGKFDGPLFEGGNLVFKFL